jgi:hypothetical protein
MFVVPKSERETLLLVTFPDLNKAVRSKRGGAIFDHVAI